MQSTARVEQSYSQALKFMLKIDTCESCCQISTAPGRVTSNTALRAFCRAESGKLGGRDRGASAGKDRLRGRLGTDSKSGRTGGHGDTAYELVDKLEHEHGCSPCTTSARPDAALLGQRLAAHRRRLSRGRRDRRGLPTRRRRQARGAREPALGRGAPRGGREKPRGSWSIVRRARASGRHGRPLPRRPVPVDAARHVSGLGTGIGCRGRRRPSDGLGNRPHFL